MPSVVADFVFSSSLPASRYDELADLMFFNVEQHRFRADIVNAIEHYGVPEIVEAVGSLRFRVEKLIDVQTLFVLDGDRETGRLAAVMIYSRVDEETLVLLHMGVDSHYASGGSAAASMLAMRLIGRLRSIARTIKGVRRLEILYGAGRTVLKV